MLNAKTLGEQMITEISNAIREADKQPTCFAHQICTPVPVSAIKERRGKAPFIPSQFLYGSEDLPAEVALSADAPTTEIELSDRDFRIRRIPLAMPYSMNLNGSELFEQVKNEFMPGLKRQIYFMIDRYHLYPILVGTGAAADSRNVTVAPIGTNKQWNLAGSEALDELEKAVEDTGADFLVLGSRTAKDLAKDAAIRDTILGHDGGSGRVQTSRLAAGLQDHLGLSGVQIGNTIYQGGSIHFAGDSKQIFQDVAFVTQRSNLAYLPWQNVDIAFHEYEDGSKRTAYLQGELHADIIIYDPTKSVAFTNLR